jgi:hypothetical protein
VQLLPELPACCIYCCLQLLLLLRSQQSAPQLLPNTGSE